jgi:hypothetical protein
MDRTPRANRIDAPYPLVGRTPATRIVDGYARVNTAVYLPPTPGELREPGTLDVYVAGAAWCDQTRPR